MKPPTITPGFRFLLNAMSAALVLRLLRLDDFSLWHDEGVTWWNATRPTVGETVTAEPNNPPLWWLVTRVWISFSGDSEWSLRMPAAILGAVSVLLAWRLAKRLLDPVSAPARAGFLGLDALAPYWVAGLAAAGAFWIQWSQEARMYAALLAESLGLSLLYLRWLDGGKKGVLVAYALLAALALHTHYFAIWPILAHAVHAFFAWRARRGTDRPLSLLGFAAAQAAAALLFVPWLLYMLPRAWGAQTSMREPFGWLAHSVWRMAVGPGVVALDRARYESGTSAALREHAALIAATAAAWFVPMVFGLVALRRDRALRGFVLASLLVPIVGVVAMAYRFAVLDEKYLVYLAPTFLILAVLGARSAPAVLRPVLLGGLVAVHAVGLVAYHGSAYPQVERAFSPGHPYGKESWREVHASVANYVKPGTLVFLHAPFLQPTWEYYEAHQPRKAPAIPLPALDVPADRVYDVAELLHHAPAAQAASLSLIHI